MWSYFLSGDIFMKYTVKLNDNKDFTALFRRGRFVAGQYCAVYFRKNGRGINRTGFSTGKKIGNAVCRNRARRIMRQAYREKEELFPKGLDIIFSARQDISGCKTYDLTDFIEKRVIPGINRELSGKKKKPDKKQ